MKFPEWDLLGVALYVAAYWAVYIVLSINSDKDKSEVYMQATKKNPGIAKVFKESAEEIQSAICNIWAAAVAQVLPA